MDVIMAIRIISNTKTKPLKISFVNFTNSNAIAFLLTFIVPFSNHHYNLNLSLHNQ